MRRASLASARAKRAARPAMAQWEAEQFRCACCHRPMEDRGLFERHHMLGGKYGRPDDPRVVLMLCGSFAKDGPRCHDLCGDHRIRRADGTLWPQITLANQLWIKETDEPDTYDPVYLQGLLGKRLLPAPLELPEIFYELREFFSL